MEAVANAVKDKITHFIQIDSWDISPEPQEFDESVDQQCFSHLARIVDADQFSSFAAQLQDVAFVYEGTTTVPQLRFESEFDGVMVDTRAGRGSSAGEKQYHGYCRFVGQKTSNDPIRAGVWHFLIEPAT